MAVWNFRGDCGNPKKNPILLPWHRMGTEQAGGGKSPHGKALEGDGNAGNTKLLVSACMGH